MSIPTTRWRGAGATSCRRCVPTSGIRIIPTIICVSGSNVTISYTASATTPTLPPITRWGFVWAGADCLTRSPAIGRITTRRNSSTSTTYTSGRSGAFRGGYAAISTKPGGWLPKSATNAAGKTCWKWLEPMKTSSRERRRPCGKPASGSCGSIWRRGLTTGTAPADRSTRCYGRFTSGTSRRDASPTPRRSTIWLVC